MAIWQMMLGGKPTLAPLFDDGGAGAPGDTGFSTVSVAAQVAALGSTADGFNYVGPSPGESS